MAMKCPKCGTENDDRSKFCQACGWALGPSYDQRPVQVPTAKKTTPTWIIALVVILVLIVGGIGASYSMPWSKIKVIVTHSEYSTIGVDVYIDGVLKASIGANPGTSILGVWSVVAGTHMVQIDAGSWHQGVITHWFSPDEYYWDYVAPDGTTDVSYAYEVGPLTTKNVYMSV